MFYVYFLTWSIHGLSAVAWCLACGYTATKEAMSDMSIVHCHKGNGQYLCVSNILRTKISSWHAR